MKTTPLLSRAILFATGLSRAIAQAPLPPNDFGNALIPDLVADPSIVEVDGTFYCYATTDGEGKHLSTSGLPVVWKSKDFLNWSFQGSIFPPGFAGKYWAPSSPILHNGKYYLYPTIDGKLTVVTSNSLDGPFVHPETGAPGWKPITPKAGGSIDAEVLIDDDGQAYMVWQKRGFGKLKPDLLDLEDGQTVLPTKRDKYAEGQYIFKRNGIYYFLYTQGGDEAYQYAYMMNRTSPATGRWEAPKDDIIASTDHKEKVFGPGHGSFIHPKGSNQWYFVYLEYGRGSTNRQIYADKMNFNSDDTIQPVTLTKQGVGALHTPQYPLPNQALGKTAITSSVKSPVAIKPNKDPQLHRTESFVPGYALDGSNGSRWMADEHDSAPWFQVDLGAVCDIHGTEAYFVQPTHGHAYRLEVSVDGKTWLPYGGHPDIIIQSPHRDKNALRGRYLKLTVLKGTPGLWEFRVY